MSQTRRITVAACESQPVTAEGLRCLIDRCPDLEFAGVVNSPAEIPRLLHNCRPAVLILDKSFGAPAVLGVLGALQAAASSGRVVVWGISVTEAEAWRFLQAGARGTLRRSASPEDLLACLRAVAAGATWTESRLSGQRTGGARRGAPALTGRERQVLELVAHGLKNREIAAELGIRPGTVKVHLKHIFEKTGVRGRYGVALADLEAASPPACFP